MGKQLTLNFYHDRVCLNVLAGSHQNAKEIYQATETYVVVGVLSKNYADLNSAIDNMAKYADEIDHALSVGLGAGDPNQSNIVLQIAKVIQPQPVVHS